MADGGQTVDQWDLVERAARRLARALGTGYAWAPDVNEVADVGPDREVAAPSSGLAICRLGQVTEQAAWSIDGTKHLRRQQRWANCGGVVAVPSYRMDQDALAALSFAKLDGPLEAILLLYATGDVPRYWPTVERYGLAVRRAVFAREALSDAMAVVLCLRQREKIPLDVRAKILGVRAASYREEVRRSRVLLAGWLERAAHRYMQGIDD